MNRSSVIAIAVFIAVLIGGYFFFQPRDGDVADVSSTAATATATVEVEAHVQAAIDFCESKGGSVETVTAAEGVAHLCATADGGKVEIGQFMKANDTE